jgi:signal peptidase I
MAEKEEVKKPKSFWKKFWFLLWKDDSFKGWIFSVVFLFIFIKFIFFPLLSFATGTSLPLAIVESCSMYHEGDPVTGFNAWWQTHETKYAPYLINELDFQNFPLENGFNKGDILFIIKANPDTLNVGDIILFNSGTGETPVIHRIMNITNNDGERIFTTIGDNNWGVLAPGNNPSSVDEREIAPNQLVGKAVLRIVPFAGWAKLIFFDHQNPPEEQGLCHEN